MDGETHPMSPAEAAAGVLLGGRYRLEKRLGGGGLGEVRLARGEQLLAKLVIAKILKNSENDPWFVKKFSQEKEALARIRHHGVVEIVGDGVTPDGKPFLAMQFVEGAPPREAIRPGGMPFAQVAGSLAYMAPDQCADNTLNAGDVYAPGRLGPRARLDPLTPAAKKCTNSTGQ